MAMTAATHVWRPSSARRVVLDGFVPVPRGTLPAAPATMSWPAKDPADVLDYEFDLSAALEGDAGDVITSLGVVVSPDGVGDLVVNSVSADGAVVVLWFAGGQVGTVYTVRITATTQNGRTIGRTVLLPVQALAAPQVPATALTTNGGAVVTDQSGSPILVGT
jgi:hypothetical protein